MKQRNVLKDKKKHKRLHKPREEIITSGRKTEGLPDQMQANIEEVTSENITDILEGTVLQELLTVKEITEELVDSMPVKR